MDQNRKSVYMYIFPEKPGKRTAYGEMHWNSIKKRVFFAGQWVDEMTRFETMALF